MGEIVLKIPQRVECAYELTEEHAAQILAELELKSKKVKPRPESDDDFKKLQAEMAKLRKNPSKQMKEAVETAERLRESWNRYDLT